MYSGSLTIAQPGLAPELAGHGGGDGGGPGVHVADGGAQLGGG